MVPVARILALLLLLTVPSAVLAFDCTPIATRACDDGDITTTTDQDAVPGDVACGFDYTGWDLKVYDVVVAEAGYVGFQALVQAQGGQVAVMVYDDCAGGSCLASAQHPNLAEVFLCLDAGTYTMVVATDFDTPQPLLIGTGCASCDDLIQAGAEDICPICGTVDTDALGWGAFKGQFE